MVLDGALAQDTTQAHAFWALRETITESIGKSGKVYKYDLSVPLDKMYGLVEKMRIRLKEKGYLKDDGSGEVMGCLGFGHMGDGTSPSYPYCQLSSKLMGIGNLHLNIVAREFKDEIKDTIEPYIYELVGKSTFPFVKSMTGIPNYRQGQTLIHQLKTAVPSLPNTGWV